MQLTRGQVDVFSLIVPVYKNELNLDRLLSEMVSLSGRLSDELELVLVVDGSPDRCFELLRERLPNLPIRSQLLLLSRNFGSFAAIGAGLEAAKGDYFAVLAADLQEPPQLAAEFFAILSGDSTDIVFGVRESRSDPFLSNFFSTVFWAIYRRFVIKDMPKGGIDVFGCNRVVRDCLLQFREGNTNLIALLFWIGYRRAYVGYQRQARIEGKSAWTLQKKIEYCLQSIFNFTDIPVKLLIYSGVIALILGCSGTVVLLSARLLGNIRVPGYTPTVLAILFFGALTNIGLGVIGQYLWLCLQNTRRRPNYIVFKQRDYGANE